MREQKYFARYKKPQVELPNLVETHLKSYKWLLEEGLKEAFKEFSPIKDYSEKKFELEFVGIELSAPKYDEYFAKENNLSYEAPLKARVKLINKTFKSEKEQEIFMADFPMMTSHGTFIVNGVERVVVPQISRSFGVSFTVDELKGKRYFGAKIIPGRGAWVEVESDPDGAVYVRIDKKRKFPVTVLLRALGLENNDAILKTFAKKDEAVKKVIEATLAKDLALTPDESFIEIHKKLRDGDLATAENARGFVNSIFAKEKYDLSEVGRFKFNKRFGKGLDKDDIARRTIDASDVATIVSHIVKLNADPRALPDDIDHLGSRRIRSVGEMLQQKIRVGMTQMKRNIQDRMSTIDTDATMPVQFISPRPLQARLKEFFATNQLSQFMSQYNVLSEIELLRTFSALGPGGLTRERAGIEVRDVHTSHYGRLCPIHTPEGPNIGLILRLSCYARRTARPQKKSCTWMR
ncbi:MAG: DNA-directed RNA polymerase subunit beta [Parcubacteria group bacterium GW2011_GWC1_44_26]|nr:MAG: DNA-directed RNA polymerase subunit beta [Parcubacteria group bacterium GW2011_GWC1_44_26]